MGHPAEIEKIASIVCDELGQTIDRLRGPSREHKVVQGRYMILYFCDKLLRRTKDEYSSYLNRAHSMVWKAKEYFSNIKNNDRFLLDRLPGIEQRIIESLSPQDPEYYKKEYAKKLSEIDYMLLLIEFDEIESYYHFYMAYTQTQLRDLLTKRLIDFAQAELYRDYSEPLNRKSA
jgi:DnaA-like protein